MNHSAPRLGIPETASSDCPAPHPHLWEDIHRRYHEPGVRRMARSPWSLGPVARHGSPSVTPGWPPRSSTVWPVTATSSRPATRAGASRTEL